jgi:4-hydroxy-3-methylbut-2-enyl diphosphate reductase
MNVILAESAGFCFGVKRAVETVYQQLAQNAQGTSPIYTYGLIIHNMAVVRDLESKGVIVLHNEEELRAVSHGTVIIRAHGVTPVIYQIIEEKGLELIDATCPYVKKIHQIVAEKSRDGQGVIIIGDPGHPEVEGITGWAEGEVWVLESEEAARNYPLESSKVGCLVAQTTFNSNKFQDIVDILVEKGYNGNVDNTICNATEERQREAQRIATKVDAVFVIGDIHSSNTAKLYEICRKECTNTYFVETLEDLPDELPENTTLTGITAGASTPNKIIEEVQNHVRTKF